MNKNQIDYKEGEPQLMQFIREKGNRVPKVLPNGKNVRDLNGKLVMVREKGNPRGILVAGMVGGVPRIGWSYTNTRMDTFDKVRGLQIAKNRMHRQSPLQVVPHKVLREIENTFLPRVAKYFGVTA